MPESELSVAEALVALHQFVESEESLESSLQRVADVTAKAISPAAGVGVTVISGGSGTTVAFHGELAPELDRAQYRDDRGPCLDAFRDDQIIYVDEIADETDRWQSFSQAAVEHGIHSSLSIPLRGDGTAIGALNLYATEPKAFDADARDIAENLAEQASISIANAAVYWQARRLAENLGVALENRDVFGQAKGILMSRRGVTSDEAWTLIRSASQQCNIKAIEVAEAVVRTGDLPDLS